MSYTASQRVCTEYLPHLPHTKLLKTAYHWTKKPLGEMELGTNIKPPPSRLFFIFSSNPISLSFQLSAMSVLNSQALYKKFPMHYQAHKKWEFPGSPQRWTQPQGSTEYCCASLQGSEHNVKDPCIAPAPANTLGKGSCL